MSEEQEGERDVVNEGVPESEAEGTDSDEGSLGYTASGKPITPAMKAGYEKAAVTRGLTWQRKEERHRKLTALRRGYAQGKSESEIRRFPEFQGLTTRQWTDLLREHAADATGAGALNFFTQAKTRLDWVYQELVRAMLVARGVDNPKANPSHPDYSPDEPRFLKAPNIGQIVQVAHAMKGVVAETRETGLKLGAYKPVPLEVNVTGRPVHEMTKAELEAEYNKNIRVAAAAFGMPVDALKAVLEGGGTVSAAMQVTGGPGAVEVQEGAAALPVATPAKMLPSSPPIPTDRTERLAQGEMLRRDFTEQAVAEGVPGLARTSPRYDKPDPEEIPEVAAAALQLPKKLPKLPKTDKPTKTLRKSKPWRLMTDEEKAEYKRNADEELTRIRERKLKREALKAARNGEKP